MNQEKLAKLQAQVRIGGKVGAAPGWRWGGRAGHGRGWHSPAAAGRGFARRGSQRRIPRGFVWRLPKIGQSEVGMKWGSAG